MKKYFIVICMMLIGVFTSAQQTVKFKSYQVIDKFDDITEVHNVKSVITHNDSMIIIEIKGEKKPMKLYRCDFYANDQSYITYQGTPDQPIWIFNDVYGYDVTILCVDEALNKKLNKGVKKITQEYMDAHTYRFCYRIILNPNTKVEIDEAMWITNIATQTRKIFNVYENRSKTSK